MTTCVLTIGCVFGSGHAGSCSPYQGHAITCPGAPNMKGMCAPPCPAYKAAHPTPSDRLTPFIEELKSQGVVAATVDDGTVFMFSRAVVEELYGRLQADPQKEHLALFIQRDPKKLAAQRAAGRN